MGAKFKFDPVSAARHNIPHADAEHAIRNNTTWVRHFDEPRTPGSPRPDLFVGPAQDGVTELEVMGNWTADGDFYVFHLMICRDKTRRRIRDHQQRAR